MSAAGWPVDVLFCSTGGWVLASFKIEVLLFSSVVRPTDEETTVIERIVCYSLFCRVEPTPGHTRSYTGSSRLRQEGKVCQEVYCGVHGKEWAGRVSR